MKQKWISTGLLALCMAFAAPSLAQVDDDDLGDFDAQEFSGYQDSEKVKRFCTQKVRLLSPAKLISIGYEVAGPFDIASKPGEISGLEGLGEQTGRVNAVHGMQLLANFPVISKSSYILNLGVNYNESTYNVSRETDHPLHRNLDRFGLRTAGVNFTLFKPLNERNFLIFQGSADFNSNYIFDRPADFSNSMTYSGAGIFGWKPNDDLMWGLGVTRTYRGGESLIIPVVMYNKTFNDRWGIEMLLPARLNVRRNFSATSLLMFGFEIVGNSYFLNTDTRDAAMGNFNQLHLRRSEVKVRFTWEKSIKDFMWISAQAGAIYFYKYGVSASESTPSGDFLIANKNTIPFYMNISLNLVSP